MEKTSGQSMVLPSTIIKPKAIKVSKVEAQVLESGKIFFNAVLC